MPALNDLAAKDYDGTHTFGQLLHIVHLYIIEPHPQSPEPSPYSGEVWAADQYPNDQPTTYAGRLEHARAMLPFLEGEQLLLVDDLSPGQDNPLWCSYGPCPNCAFLIRQDGILEAVQDWYNPPAMETIIRGILP